MPGADVDSLILTISTESASARSGIDEITGSLDELGGSAGAAAQNLSALREHLSAISQSFGQYTNVTSSAAGSNEEMLHSVQSIAGGLENLHNETIRVSSQLDFVQNYLRGFSEEAEQARQNGENLTSVMRQESEQTRAAIKSLRGNATARREVASATREMHKETVRAAPSMGNFLSLIKRIVTIRLIRAAFMGVISGIKEGIQNLYAFSDATDKTFSSAMDNATTATKYIQNSFATVIAPILQSVIPLLDKLSDMFAFVADKLAQFFSALNGETTYYSALKYGVKYGDETADSLEKAVKQQRYLISGFDELNVYSSKAAKSASGADGEDYTKMFEVREISGAIQSVADIVREAIGGVVDFLGDYAFIFGVIALCTGHPFIGLGLMTYSALEFFGAQGENSDDGKETLKTIKRALTYVATATKIPELMVVSGFVLMFTGNFLPGLGLLLGGGLLRYFGAKQANNDNGANLSGTITGIIKSVADMLSGYEDLLVIGGIVLMFTGQFALGLGLFFADGVLSFFHKSKGENDNGLNLVESIKGITLSIMQKLRQYKDMLVVSGIVLMFTGQFLAGVSLILIGEIADRFGAGKADLSLDGLTGALKDIAKDFIAEIPRLGSLAVAVGIGLLFTSHFLLGIGLILGGITAINIAKPNMDAGGLISTVGNFFSDALDKSAKIVGAIGLAILPFAPTVGAKMLAYAAVAGVFSAFTNNPDSTIYDNNFGTHADWINADHTPNYTNFKSYLSGSRSTSFDDVRQSLDGAYRWANGVNDTEMAKSYKALLDYLNKYERTLITSNFGIPSFEEQTNGAANRPWARASGGFVPNGDLFLANEYEPEYIGSIGRRTAVANNDQIIQGIARGVASALGAYVPGIIDAIEENKTTVAIGDEQIAEAASNGNIRVRRQTGRSLPGLA